MAPSIEPESIISQFKAHWEWTGSDGTVHTEPFMYPDFDGELDRYVEQFIDPEIERDFPVERAEWAGDFASGSIHNYLGGTRSVPVYPLRDAPRPKLNVLFFPTMASQFAHIAALFDNDAIEVGQKITLKTNATIVRDASFFFGVSNKTDVELYVVTKRPLNDQIISDWNAPKGLCLCVLVDWRYFMRGAMYKFEPFTQIPGYEDGTTPSARVVSYRSTRPDELADLFDSRPDYTLLRVFWTLFKTKFFSYEDFIAATTSSVLFQEGYPSYFADAESSESSSTIAQRRADYDNGQPYLHRYSVDTAPYPTNYSSDLETRSGVLQLPETFDRKVFREGAPLLLVLDAALACFGTRLYAGNGVLRAKYTYNDACAVSPRNPPRVMFPIDNTLYEQTVELVRERLREFVTYLRNLPKGSSDLYENGVKVRDLLDALGTSFPWTADATEYQRTSELRNAKTVICQFFSSLLSEEDAATYEQEFTAWINIENDWDTSPLFDYREGLYARLVETDFSALARVAYGEAFQEDYRTFVDAESLDAPYVYYAPKYWTGDNMSLERSVNVVTNDPLRYVHPQREKNVLKIAADEEMIYTMRARYLADVVETFMILPERVVLRFGSTSKNGYVNVILNSPERDPSLTIGDVPNPFVLPIGNAPDTIKINTNVTKYVGGNDVNLTERYPFTHLVTGTISAHNNSFIEDPNGDVKLVDSHTLVTSKFIDFFHATTISNNEYPYALELPSIPTSSSQSVASVVYRGNIWINGGDFQLENKMNYGVQDGQNYASFSVLDADSLTEREKSVIQRNIDYPWTLSWRGLPTIQLADEYLFNSNEYSLESAENSYEPYNRTLSDLIKQNVDAICNTEVGHEVDLEERGLATVRGKTSDSITIRLSKDIDDDENNSNGEEGYASYDAGWTKRLLVSHPLKLDAISKRLERSSDAIDQSKTAVFHRINGKGESVTINVERPSATFNEISHEEVSVVLGVDREAFELYVAGDDICITTSGYYSYVENDTTLYKRYLGESNPEIQWNVGTLGKKYISVRSHVVGDKGIYVEYHANPNQPLAKEKVSVSLDFYAITSENITVNGQTTRLFVPEFVSDSRFVSIAQTTTSERNPRKKTWSGGSAQNAPFGDGFTPKWKGFDAHIGSLRAPSASSSGSGSATVSLTKEFNAIAAQSPLTLETRVLSNEEQSQNNDSAYPSEATKLLVIKCPDMAEYAAGCSISITDGTAADGTEGKKVINNTLEIIGTQGIVVQGGPCENGYTISLDPNYTSPTPYVAGCGISITDGTMADGTEGKKVITNTLQITAGTGIQVTGDPCSVGGYVISLASGYTPTPYVAGCSIEIADGTDAAGVSNGTKVINNTLLITAGTGIQVVGSPCSGGYTISIASDYAPTPYVAGCGISITDGTELNAGKKVISNTLQISAGTGIRVTGDPCTNGGYTISLAPDYTSPTEYVAGCGISIREGTAAEGKEGKKVIDNTLSITAGTGITVSGSACDGYTISADISLYETNTNVLADVTPRTGTAVTSVYPSETVQALTLASGSTAATLVKDVYVSDTAHVIKYTGAAPSKIVTNVSSQAKALATDVETTTGQFVTEVRPSTTAPCISLVNSSDTLDKVVTKVTSSQVSALTFTGDAPRNILTNATTDTKSLVTRVDATKDTFVKSVSTESGQALVLASGSTADKIVKDVTTSNPVNVITYTGSNTLDNVVTRVSSDTKSLVTSVAATQDYFVKSVSTETGQALILASGSEAATLVKDVYVSDTAHVIKYTGDAPSKIVTNVSSQTKALATDVETTTGQFVTEVYPSSSVTAITIDQGTQAPQQVVTDITPSSVNVLSFTGEAPRNILTNATTDTKSLVTSVAATQGYFVKSVSTESGQALILASGSEANTVVTDVDTSGSAHVITYTGDAPSQIVTSISSQAKALATGVETTKGDFVTSVYPSSTASCISLVNSSDTLDKVVTKVTPSSVNALTFTGDAPRNILTNATSESKTLVTGIETTDGYFVESVSTSTSPVLILDTGESAEQIVTDVDTSGSAHVITYTGDAPSQIVTSISSQAKTLATGVETTKGDFVTSVYPSSTASCISLVNSSDTLDKVVTKVTSSSVSALTFTGDAPRNILTNATSETKTLVTSVAATNDNFVKSVSTETGRALTLASGVTANKIVTDVSASGSVNAITYDGDTLGNIVTNVSSATKDIVTDVEITRGDFVKSVSASETATAITLSTGETPPFQVVTDMEVSHENVLTYEGDAPAYVVTSVSSQPKTLVTGVETTEGNFVTSVTASETARAITLGENASALEQIVTNVSASSTPNFLAVSGNTTVNKIVTGVSSTTTSLATGVNKTDDYFVKSVTSDGKESVLALGTGESATQLVKDVTTSGLVNVMTYTGDAPSSIVTNVYTTTKALATGVNTTEAEFVQSLSPDHTESVLALGSNASAPEQVVSKISTTTKTLVTGVNTTDDYFVTSVSASGTATVLTLGTNATAPSSVVTGVSASGTAEVLAVSGNTTVNKIVTGVSSTTTSLATGVNKTDDYFVKSVTSDGKESVLALDTGETATQLVKDVTTSGPVKVITFPGNSPPTKLVYNAPTQSKVLATGGLELSDTASTGAIPIITAIECVDGVLTWTLKYLKLTTESVTCLTKKPDTTTVGNATIPTVITPTMVNVTTKEVSKGFTATPAKALTDVTASTSPIIVLSAEPTTADVSTSSVMTGVTSATTAVTTASAVTGISAPTATALKTATPSTSTVRVFSAVPTTTAVTTKNVPTSFTPTKTMALTSASPVTEDVVCLTATPDTKSVGNATIPTVITPTMVNVTTKEVSKGFTATPAKALTDVTASTSPIIVLSAEPTTADVSTSSVITSVTPTTANVGATPVVKTISAPTDQAIKTFSSTSERLDLLTSASSTAVSGTTAVTTVTPTTANVGATPVVKTISAPTEKAIKTLTSTSERVDLLTSASTTSVSLQSVPTGISKDTANVTTSNVITSITASQDQVVTAVTPSSESVTLIASASTTAVSSTPVVGSISTETKSVTKASAVTGISAPTDEALVTATAETESVRVLTSLPQTQSVGGQEVPTGITKETANVTTSNVISNVSAPRAKAIKTVTPSSESVTLIASASTTAVSSTPVVGSISTETKSVTKASAVTGISAPTDEALVTATAETESVRVLTSLPQTQSVGGQEVPTGITKETANVTTSNVVTRVTAPTEQAVKTVTPSSENVTLIASASTTNVSSTQVVGSIETDKTPVRTSSVVVGISAPVGDALITATAKTESVRVLTSLPQTQSVGGQEVPTGITKETANVTTSNVVTRVTAPTEQAVKEVTPANETVDLLTATSTVPVSVQPVPTGISKQTANVTTSNVITRVTAPTEQAVKEVTPVSESVTLIASASTTQVSSTPVVGSISTETKSVTKASAVTGISAPVDDALITATAITEPVRVLTAIPQTQSVGGQEVPTGISKQTANVDTAAVVTRIGSQTDAFVKEINKTFVSVVKSVTNTPANEDVQTEENS